MNRSRPFSITVQHELAAIVGLAFLLVLTLYLLPLPAILGAGAQRVRERFT